MKKLIGAFGISMLLLVLFVSPVFAEAIKQNINVVYNNIKIVVDGKIIVPEDVNGNIVEPFIYNGTTYLPVRAVSQALGKDVDWDEKTKTVYISEIISPQTPTKVETSEKGTVKVEEEDIPLTETPRTNTVEVPKEEGNGSSNQRTVYITPSGQRYHYSASCAGKNATPVDISNVGSRTPCQKCVH